MSLPQKQKVDGAQCGIVILDVHFVQWLALTLIQVISLTGQGILDLSSAPGASKIHSFKWLCKISGYIPCYHLTVLRSIPWHLPYSASKSSQNIAEGIECAGFLYCSVSTFHVKRKHWGLITESTCEILHMRNTNRNEIGNWEKSWAHISIHFDWYVGKIDSNQTCVSTPDIYLGRKESS